MMNELYTLLRLEIINLDKKNIYVEQTQKYFGFKYRKLDKSFANVYVQKELIRIHLSTLQEYSDPKKLLHEVNYENWGPLRKFVEIRSEDDLDNAMALVEQSFSFVSFYCQEKINNSITSPEPSYENSHAWLATSTMVEVVSPLISTRTVLPINSFTAPIVPFTHRLGVI